MLDIKNKAVELRKTGISYRAISNQLGVSISTLSSWFSGENWSKEIGQKLIENAIKSNSLKLAQFKKARTFALQFSYARAKEDAEKEYKKARKNPLFFVGMMLYWALGDQASLYYLRLQSSDPKKILLFKTFLEDQLQVPPEKIRYTLKLSNRQDSEQNIAVWAKNAKIPLFCFTKSTFARKPRGKTPATSSVCTATYSSRIHKEKMLVWLRLHVEELSKDVLT